MTLLEEIKDVESWEQGVALYNKYGKKSGLKLRFARHRSPALEKKLVYELNKLVQRERRKISINPAPQNDPPQKKSGGISSGSGSISWVYTKPTNRILLYREQTHLHQNLESMPDDKARKKAAFRILEIETEIRLIEDGIAPKRKDPIAEIPSDKGLMMKMLNNNRAYISKNKNKEKYMDKVAFRTVQNIEIEKRLK